MSRLGLASQTSCEQGVVASGDFTATAISFCSARTHSNQSPVGTIPHSSQHTHQLQLVSPHTNCNLSPTHQLQLVSPHTNCNLSPHTTTVPHCNSTLAWSELQRVTPQPTTVLGGTRRSYLLIKSFRSSGRSAGRRAGCNVRGSPVARLSTSSP